MPADTPSPLDTTTLVQVLKHQLGVEYVVLAGYLKVSAASLASPLYLQAWSILITDVLQ